MTPARLLVVDDNEMNREFLRRRLVRLGYTVGTAASGQEALAIAELQPIDLILLDVEMPGLSGLDVLRVLRQRHSQVELPVIMVSARHDSEMIVEALGLGANDYVTKPVDFPVATARLAAQLARRRTDSPAPALNPLTRLPARPAIERWNAGRTQTDRGMAVLCLNLDRFRAVNNGLGRAAGDALLVELADRLRAHTPQDALLVHLDADDFVLLLADTTTQTAMTLATTLLRDIRRPFSIDDQLVMLKASVGIAGGAGRPVDELLGEADAALYRAKTQSGGQWAVFDTDIQSRVAERLRLETELQRAIDADEFELVYQPIVNLSTDALAGFEVLVRWNHPVRGVVMPAAFIPVAEETGLIGQIGEIVLRRACVQLRKWQDEGSLVPPQTLSVNVSGRQLKASTWLDLLTQVIADTGVEPRGLRLEITETVLLEDIERIPDVLRRTRALGVALALDDFGTGYSSLSYLQQFALNSIKVDRSFVGRLTCPDGGPGVVTAILQLAATLGMDVVAEGIESPGQLAQLRALGCTYGQGYLLSRPLPLAQAARLLITGQPVSANRAFSGPAADHRGWPAIPLPAARDRR